MKKIAILLTLSLLLTLGLTTAASAISSNLHWYIITKPNENGPTVNMTAANKRYTHVAVNTSDTSKPVTVMLYKVTSLGINNEWYGNDQQIFYGVGETAWWYGDTSGNRNYFIRAETEAGEMTLSGWFENFQ